MTIKKKQQGKSDTPVAPETKTVIHPMLDYSGRTDDQGNESWRKWKVKPDLVLMIDWTQPGEAVIAKRIAYCRGQLDNLSVEALSRYTKYFDPVGVSKASIVRYEGGDSFPGARELRILCDALWVSPNWLLLGKLDSQLEHQTAAKLVDALADFIQESNVRFNTGTILDSVSQARKTSEKIEIEKRQRWIEEARKPTSR